MGTLILAVAIVEGCRGATGPEKEQPAPPDRFVVVSGAGIRRTGPAARVEIKHVDAAPEVEVTLSASDGSGGTWSAHALAPPDFLETLNLSAKVIDGPLEPGTASVQLSLPGADASFAPSGRLELRLRAGWLAGKASGMRDELSAELEGPFAVTCSVPAASMAAEAPAPTSESELPALIVDENFESPLCQRYAALAAGGSRRR